MFLAYGLPAGAIITTPANVEPKQSIIQNANRLEEDTSAKLGSNIHLGKGEHNLEE
jgi:hypothetical protein